MYLRSGLDQETRRRKVPIYHHRRPPPRAFTAQRAYEVVVGGTERVATVVTGRLQVGSVPTYLSVVLVAVIALPGKTARTLFTTFMTRLPPRPSCKPHERAS